MKHLFYKLAAFLVTLMCVSAAAQAEIVHHEMGWPKLSQRGFSQECWEDTATDKFYSDAACTQELVGEALAKAVRYERLPTNPRTAVIGNCDEFDQLSPWDYDFNWDVVASFAPRSVQSVSIEYKIKEEKPGHARLVMLFFKQYALRNLNVTVNGTPVYAASNENFAASFHVINIPNVKTGDVILFSLETDDSNMDYSELHTSLEYTFDCAHEYVDGSCSKCGSQKAPESIHHTVCEPTLSTRGFTKECWENIETSKYYANEALTQELVDEALAKTVVYAKLPASPITATYAFTQSEHENDWGVDFNWAAVTTFTNAYLDTWSSVPRYAEFVAPTGNIISNARLVWNRNQKATINGQYTVSIYVNGNQIFSRSQYAGQEFEGVFVQPLPDLKGGDVVMFKVTQDFKATFLEAQPTFKACLEYNAEECTHEYPEGSAICSKCGYIKEHTHVYPEGSPICSMCGYEKEHEYVHHTVCEPTQTTLGFTQDCWEDIYTHKFYADEAHTAELTNLALARVVIYNKLSQSPIYHTNAFNQSEYEKDWDVDFNWAAVTTFTDAKSNFYEAARYVDFTPTEDNITNARLVWNRSHGDIVNGRYTVKIYVNGRKIYSIDQKEPRIVEGVFVQALPGLKRGDIVTFEVRQDGQAIYANDDPAPTFKACLEYRIARCTHEYPEGSVICSKCGEVMKHEHIYEDCVCTLCGQADLFHGYVGADADHKNIMWTLDKDTHVLTFTGTGEMETFNAEHNKWATAYKDDITTIIIGEGITNLAGGSEDANYFGGMKSMTEISLPSTLKTIGSGALAHCCSLSSITLPKGLLTIKEYAFNKANLQCVTLQGAPAIEANAFAHCDGLEDFYLMSACQPSENAIFGSLSLDNATLHVNNRWFEWAKSTTPWSKFGKIVPVVYFNVKYTDAEGESHEVDLNTEASDNTFTLIDGWKSLAIYEDIPVQELTYTRTFSNTNWQALYVPFSMDYEEWSNDYDIAEINNFIEYDDNDDGIFDRTYLVVLKKTSGCTEPNYPYLIRAKSEGTHTLVLTDKTLEAAASNSGDCCSFKHKYTFTGTYETVATMYANGYYAMSGGALKKAESAGATLGAQRWYMSITSRVGEAPNKLNSIRILVEGEDTTTIEALRAGESASRVYDLSGRAVSQQPSAHGVYINGGKKVIK